MQTAGSLIFRPERAPSGWRLVATRTWYLWLLVGLALALSDGVGTIDWIVLGLLVVAVALMVPAWIQRLRGRAGGRYDEREEVELPAELIDRVVELRARNENAEAFSLMQSETGLGLGDTVRALEQCDAARGRS